MSKEETTSRYNNLVTTNDAELDTIDTAITQVLCVKTVVGDLAAEVEDIAETVFKIANHLKRLSAHVEIMEGNLQSKRDKLTGGKEPAKKPTTAVKPSNEVKKEHHAKQPKVHPVISDQYTSEEKQQIIKITEYIKACIQSFWSQTALTKQLNNSNVNKVLENIPELYGTKTKIFKRLKIPMHHGLIIHVLIDQCGSDDIKSQLNYNNPDGWNRLYAEYKDILKELDLIFKV